MIFIERNHKDENGNHIKPSEAWLEKAEEAKNIAINERENHKPDDKVYGHIHVRAALEKLFYDKCAYCESKITVSEWNVEHFRPKGRVAERPGHPGYYWLTYDWDNLFPACAFCNQRRKDKPRWGDLSYGKTGGKSDQFPLEDEETRAMSHNDDIYNEVALLIDPCYDDPEWYIEYGVLGNISSIENNPFGIAAINVCNL